MRCFGLTPDAVLARGVPPGAKLLSVAASVAYGALSFGAASVLAFSAWVFKVLPDARGLYAAAAIVYLLLAGLALSRLVIGRGAWQRFPLVFALAFLANGLCTGAIYYALGGKYQAGLWAAVAGLAAMTWILRRAFGKTDGFLQLFSVLFLLNGLGYFAGGQLARYIGGYNGAFAWAAAYGLGFGAGLGYVIFHAQDAVRKRLPAVA